MGGFAQTAVFPLIVILLLVYLASQVLLPRSSDAEHEDVTYSELIDAVGTSPERISSVLFLPASNGIETTFVDGRVAASHYPTEASQVRFQELLERQTIPFDSEGTGRSGWQSLGTYLLPFALFFAFWLFLMRQAEGRAWPGRRRTRGHPDLPDES